MRAYSFTLFSISKGLVVYNTFWGKKPAGIIKAGGEIKPN